MINGFDHSGNHALQKVLGMLGISVDVWHRPYSMGMLPNETKCIFVKRDPRNILISKMKFASTQPIKDWFVEKLDYKCGWPVPKTFIELMTDFTPWLSDPNTFVVKYEDLVVSGAEIQRLCNSLNLPYLSTFFTNLPGDTLTWNDKTTDFTLEWNVNLEREWNNRGGNKLLTDWGYL